MAEEVERIFIIPLKKTGIKLSKAAPTAVKRVKSYLTRHMKVEEENIWIDDSLNNALWSHGKYKLTGKIRVKAVKFDDGVVEAYLPELEFKKSRRELLKEEREKKEPILRKEEAEAEEGEVAGAEDFEISPASEGAVRIKKKKAPKEKKKKKPTRDKKESKEEKTKKSKKKPVKKVEKKETKHKTTKKPSKPKSAKKKSTSKKKSE